MNLPHSMLQSFNDPQHLHAMLVHLPVAGSLFGLVLTIALVINRGRSGGLRWATILVLALSTGAALWARDAGGDAMERAAEMDLTDATRQELNTHEDMGDAVWIWLAVSTGLVLLTALKPVPVRIATLSLSLLATLGGAGWVAVTAHHGGTLVYTYGTGVPSSPNNLNPAPESKSAPQSAPTTAPTTAPAHGS